MSDGITVSELIEFLRKQPQDIKVVYELYSEQALLELEDIRLGKFCQSRVDGWVQNARPDMETQTYLVFPGN
jgi:hypothetical protein